MNLPPVNARPAGDMFGADVRCRLDVKEDGTRDMVFEVFSLRATHSVLATDGRPRVTGFPIVELARLPLEEFLRLHGAATEGTLEIK